MFIVRTATRTYDETYEVELTDDIKQRLQDIHIAYQGEDASPLEFDDLMQGDMAQIWTYLSELHSEDGQVITMADDWGNDVLSEEESYQMTNESVISESVQVWA